VIFVLPEPQLGFAKCLLYFRQAPLAQSPMLQAEHTEPFGNLFCQ